MPFPNAMKAADVKRWMVRLKGNKDPISPLTTPPEGVTPAADEPPDAWRYQWVKWGHRVRVTFPEAAEVVKANPDVYAGVNFILHPDGDKTIRGRFICADFDHGIDPATKQPWPEVQEFIAQMKLWGDVFVEVSQSGNGVHVFMWVVCAPFTNVMQRAINAACKVDMLCNAQVACTGKVWDGNAEITGEVPFTALLAFPWFTEKESVSNSCEFNFKQEWWDQPDPGIPAGYEEARNNMLSRVCVEKSGASLEMIHAARWLVHQGITGHLAVNLLRLIPSFDQHGAPYPWKDEELMHKVMQAYARAKNSGTLDKGMAALAGEFGVIAGAAAESMPEFVKPPVDRYLKHRHTEGELKRLRPAPMPEVIRNVLRMGSVMNFISYPKFGKTFFLDQLIVCFIHNVPFMGFDFGDVPRRVLCMDNELDEWEVWNRRDRICKIMDLPPIPEDAIVNITLREEVMHLNEIAAGIYKHEKPGYFGLTTLDSCYQAWENESDPVEMRKFFATFKHIAGFLQTAGVGVHHTSKGNQSEKSKTDVGSGSGVIARAVDAHCIVRQHEEDDCSVLDWEIRSFACPPPAVIKRIKDGDAMTFAMQPHLDPAKLFTGKPVSGEEVLENVFNFVRNSPGNSSAGIAATMRENVKVVQDALRHLVNNGRVLSESVTDDRGKIVQLYRVNPDGPARGAEEFDTIDPTA